MSKLLLSALFMLNICSHDVSASFFCDMHEVLNKAYDQKKNKDLYEYHMQNSREPLEDEKQAVNNLRNIAGIPENIEIRIVTAESQGIESRPIGQSDPWKNYNFANITEPKFQNFYKNIINQGNKSECPVFAKMCDVLQSDAYKENINHIYNAICDYWSFANHNQTQKEREKEEKIKLPQNYGAKIWLTKTKKSSVNDVCFRKIGDCFLMDPVQIISLDKKDIKYCFTYIDDSSVISSSNGDLPCIFFHESGHAIDKFSNDKQISIKEVLNNVTQKWLGINGINKNAFIDNLKTIKENENIFEGVLDIISEIYWKYRKESDDLANPIDLKSDADLKKAITQIPDEFLMKYSSDILFESQSELWQIAGFTLNQYQLQDETKYIFYINTMSDMAYNLERGLQIRHSHDALESGFSTHLFSFDYNQHLEFRNALVEIINLANK